MFTLLKVTGSLHCQMCGAPVQRLPHKMASVPCQWNKQRLIPSTLFNYIYKFCSLHDKYCSETIFVILNFSNLSPLPVQLWWLSGIFSQVFLVSYKTEILLLVSPSIALWLQNSSTRLHHQGSSLGIAGLRGSIWLGGSIFWRWYFDMRIQ